MSSFSLRDKQARMALDYDRDIAERAFNMSKKWIKQFNETYLAPERQEKAVAFEIDNYFIKLQNAADVVLDSYYSSRDEQPTAEIVKIYNSLVAYLNQYVARNPLNQRDWSIIEDKFDLISVPIGKISAIADANGWRGRETMATLNDLLEYHNYVSLDNRSLKQMPLDAQKFSVPSVRFDTPILPQENVYVPPRGAEMETQTIQPDQMKIKQYIKSLTATQINAILDKMPEEQSTVLFAKLADKKKIKDKRSILQQQAESDLGFADLLMEEMQAVPPRPAASAYPAPQTQADFERLQREEQLNADWEAFLAAEELGAEFNEPPPEEEEGSGRRRSKKHGKGTPEGILGGLPGGMRNALALRPIDRRPLNLDNPMPDNEEDLSLPRRMQFLTTTEHYRLYDDDEPQINSQSQYKKMKKRLAKLRD
jgi:hypothetical protein